MNLYLIAQDVNGKDDTYSEAVVAARSADDARLLHPGGIYEWEGQWVYTRTNGSKVEQGTCLHWARPEQVTAKKLGTAVEGIERGIICASYHAG